jgi:hypothetical protein
LALRLPHGVTLEFEYAYMRRNAFSPVEAEIEEVKDYTCNRFAVRLAVDNLF